MPLLNLFIPLGARYMCEVMKFVLTKEKVNQDSVPLLYSSVKLISLLKLISFFYKKRLQIMTTLLYYEML